MKKEKKKGWPSVTEDEYEARQTSEKSVVVFQSGHRVAHFIARKRQSKAELREKIEFVKRFREEALQ